MPRKKTHEEKVDDLLVKGPPDDDGGWVLDRAKIKWVNLDDYDEEDEDEDEPAATDEGKDAQIRALQHKIGQLEKKAKQVKGLKKKVEDLTKELETYKGIIG